MIRLIDIEKLAEKKEVEMKILKKEILSLDADIQNINKEILCAEKARIILQKVAKDLQSEVEVKIGNLVTSALTAIFDESYKFRISFVEKRGRTECELRLQKNGMELDILDSCGGGVADVVSFALRIANRVLSGNSLLLIFDEPFKNINDESRSLHEKIALFIHKISRQLRMQMIVVTMIQEIIDIADKKIKIT